MSGVYKIESKLKSNRIYIGSAVDIFKRWKQHLAALKRNKHINKKLQRHYNKYSKNDLVFSIIIVCDKEDLISTEQFYLDTFHTWFNTCKIAGNTLGIKASLKTKRKLSKLKKGKPSWSKGKHLSEKHRKNIGLSQMGENNSFFNRKHTDKAKKIIGEKSKQMHIAKKLKVA